MASSPKTTSTVRRPASARIPPIARPFVSERALRTLDTVERFVEEQCIPADDVYMQQLGTTAEQRFGRSQALPQVMTSLKTRARELGLWNLFLPEGGDGGGAGFSNLEYGLMAELLGKSRIASEATNCSAPDTGNMEVLAKYGTEAQKREWLVPLLQGEIRSAFLMTEPDVASSDARNIKLEMRRDGDEWVLNGEKWWSSGAGDPRCKLYIVMGRTRSSKDEEESVKPSPYRQQSVILVPANTPGVTVKRMLSVFGYDDAPHGHAHIQLKDVRVPAANIILGEGRGFEVVQGRLGPGRIHHAMRCIGAAERAHALLLARATDPTRKPSGKLLSEHSLTQSRIAQSRIDIDAARLAVLNAAIHLDGHHRAQHQQQQQQHSSTSQQPTSKPIPTPPALITAITSAKILSARACLATIDTAIQAHGGAGVSQDTPLAAMWAQARTMRIVDGPDEVHLLQLGRRECREGAKNGERNGGGVGRAKL